MKKKSKFTYLATGTALVGTISSLGASATKPGSLENKELDESKKVSNFFNGQEQVKEYSKDTQGVLVNYQGKNLFFDPDLFGNTSKKNNSFKREDSNSESSLTEENTNAKKKNEELDLTEEEMSQNGGISGDREEENKRFLTEDGSEISLVERDINEVEKGEDLDLIKEEFSRTAQGVEENDKTTPLLSQKLSTKKSSFGSKVINFGKKAYALGKMLCPVVATMVDQAVTRITGGKTKSEKIGGLAGYFLGYWKLPSLVGSALGVGATTVFMIPTLASIGVCGILNDLGITGAVAKAGKALGGLVGKGLSKIFKRKSKNVDKKKEKIPKDLLNVVAGRIRKSGMLDNDVSEDQLKDMIKEMYSNGQYEEMLKNVNNGQIGLGGILKPFPEENEEISADESQSQQPTANENSKGDGVPVKLGVEQKKGTMVLKKIVRFCVTASVCTTIGTGLTMGLGVPVTTAAFAAYGIYRLAPVALAIAVATPAAVFYVIKNTPRFVRGIFSFTSTIGKSIIKKITGSKANSAKNQNEGVNNFPSNQLPSGFGLKV